MKTYKNNPSIDTVKKRINISITFFVILVSSTFPSFCQVSTPTVFQDWSSAAGTQNNFQRSIVRSKGLSGVTYYYVCGSTINSSGNYDIFIEKKTATGTVLWTQSYNGLGNGNDYGTDIQISNSGSIYVSGTYFHNSTDSSNGIVIKYNASGVQQWVHTFNGAGTRNDAYSAMQVSSNTIVAVGTTYKNSTNLNDMLITRLDTTGNQVWSQTWNYTNLNDAAVNLWNRGNSIYIAGAVQSASSTYKYGVFYVKASDGTILGSNTTGGNAFGYDKLTDIQYDLSGNIYLTGSVLNVSSMYDIKTVKLDSALNMIWSATYDGGSNLNDFGSGLCLDTAGNVIVSGSRRTNSSLDYVVIKYNKNGVLRWTSTFDGGTLAQDSATAIVVRDTNEIYVTGFSYDSTYNKDYYTLKYDGAGNVVWEISFDNWNTANDVATAIALDSVGGVVVSGQCETFGGVRTYTTVRYEEYDFIYPPDTDMPSNAFSFEENRGQLFNTDNSPEGSIKYYCKNTWPMTYISDTSVTYMWARIDTTTANDTIHRIDMEFIGSNTNSKVRATGKQTNYYSYLQGYYDTPFPGVPIYSDLLRAEVYSKIDVIYSSNNVGLKHYFVVKVGGDPKNIEMKFNGADSVSINMDTLMIYSSLGVLKQPKAIVYEIDNNGARVPLMWQPDYFINGNGNVEFANIGSYTASHVLVIECSWGDPLSPSSAINSLEWSTFMGGVGSSYDLIWDIVANGLNRSWFSGTTAAYPFSGTVGPTSAQLSYTGNSDAFVASFNSIAENLWFAYLGGGAADNGYNCGVDGLNNLYLIGVTQSSNFTNLSNSGINYPNQGGANEGYFAVLNSTGTNTLCDSYIGGSGGDHPYGIAVSKGTLPGSLDIYIVGGTGSTANFPITPGGNYDQSVFGGGGADAFIMRLNQNFSNVWTTYFGGNGTEFYTNVALRNPNNEPVAVGWATTATTTNNTCGVPPTGQFPICDNNGSFYSQAFGGGQQDLIISEFASNNSLVWSTYFGGPQSEAYNTSRTPDVTIANSDIYIVSNTSFGGWVPFFPSANGGNYLQTAISTTGGTDVFIARFNSSRQRSWVTFFGRNGYATGLGITSDANNNVYITGANISSNLASPPNYCQVPSAGVFPICNLSGNNYMEINQTSQATGRAFIAAFNPNDNLIWSTMFTTNISTDGMSVFATTDKLFLTCQIMNAYSLADYDQLSTIDYFVSSYPANTITKVNGISRFDITQITGVEEEHVNAFNSVSIFPNPAANTVTLQSAQNFEPNSTVRIVDATGRLVSEHNCLPGTNSISLDVSTLSNGLYSIQLQNGDSFCSSKLVINH